LANFQIILKNLNQYVSALLKINWM